jgi:hypothetical protein
MAIRKSSSSGTPFGNTAGRPSSPSIGQTYYNGQLGYLEIYTVSGWIPATGANDFSLNITGINTSITFEQSYSSGSYSIVSFGNDLTLDIYAYASDGLLAGYTNTKSFTATERFNKMVILGGSIGDVLSFSYKTTYATSTTTSDVTAGPYVTSVSPSDMPKINDTITVTGGNFAANAAVHFTGTGYTSTAAKSVVRNSATSLTITRPDNLPVSGSPYTITVTNPSVGNQPTGSSVHTYTGITAGNNPSWITGSTLGYGTGINYPVTVSASDIDLSTITYSLYSGILPVGLSLNSSTGVISGTSSDSSSRTFVLRATDAEGNYSNKEFTMVPKLNSTGGTMTRVGGYQIHSFTTNGNFTPTFSGNVEYLVVAGGGGASGRHSGGGGGGQVTYNSSYSVTSGTTYSATVGAGGTGVTGTSQVGSNGANSAFIETAYGGGYSGTYSTPTNGAAGGSGGGGGYGGGSGGASNKTSSSIGALTYGNNGGSNCIWGSGGGGAGAVGASNTDQNGSSGGNGIANSILGTSYYWGGGGGGSLWSQSGKRAGDGGLGGGGGGGHGKESGQNGTGGLGGGSALNAGADGLATFDNASPSGGDGGANTGGGGGGSGQSGHQSYTGKGGNGGSGIVVVRFAI